MDTLMSGWWWVVERLRWVRRLTEVGRFIVGEQRTKQKLRDQGRSDG